MTQPCFDCRGSQSVRMHDIAVKLKKSSSSHIVAENILEFIGELDIACTTSVWDLANGRQYRNEPVYKLYMGILRKLVEKDPENATKNLTSALESINCAYVAGRILRPDKRNAHICKSCKIVDTPDQTNEDVDSRTTSKAYYYGRNICICVLVLVCIILGASLIGVFVKPELDGKLHNPLSDPLSDNLTSTLQTQSISSTTPIIPDFVFGPPNNYVPDYHKILSEEYTLQLETYSDLQSRYMSEDRNYAIHFLNWTYVPNKTLVIDRPSRITSLSITGDILPQQLAQMLKSFYNLRSLTLNNPLQFCQALERMANVKPLRLKRTRIKHLNLIDMPSNCAKGIRYLSWIINNVGSGYRIEFRKHHNHKYARSSV